MNTFWDIELNLNTPSSDPVPAGSDASSKRRCRERVSPPWDVKLKLDKGAYLHRYTEPSAKPLPATSSALQKGPGDKTAKMRRAMRANNLTNALDVDKYEGPFKAPLRAR